MSQFIQTYGRETSLVNEQLKKFILENNIIGTCAGVSIALVTKDAIQSFVGDIIIPFIYILLIRLNIKSLTAILPDKSNLNIRNFIKEVVSWIFVIIITFLFIKIAFMSLLGIDVNEATKEKIERDKAAIETEKEKEKREAFFGGGYYP